MLKKAWLEVELATFVFSFLPFFFFFLLFLCMRFWAHVCLPYFFKHNLYIPNHHQENAKEKERRKRKRQSKNQALIQELIQPSSIQHATCICCESQASNAILKHVKTDVRFNSQQGWLSLSSFQTRQIIFCTVCCVGSLGRDLEKQVVSCSACML